MNNMHASKQMSYVKGYNYVTRYIGKMFIRSSHIQSFDFGDS